MASTPPINILIVFLITIACFSFLFGIYKASYISWQKVPDTLLMPAFLSNVVTSIAAVLATNLGAVLGYANADTHSLFRNPATWNPLNLFSSGSVSPAQAFACYIYVLGLLSATVVWGYKNFTTDEKQVVPLLPQLTKSLLGVVIGALAIALNVPHT